MASVVKPQVAKMIEQWLTINEVEDFKNRIYSTIRDIYTVIRN